MIEITADGCVRTMQQIGYEHEQNRVQLQLPLEDIADAAEDETGGTYSLAYKRMFDEDFYTSEAFEISEDGNYLIWTVGAHALEQKGEVEVQISYSTADMIAQTRIFRFRVGRSIMEGDAGDPSTLATLIESALTAAGAVSQAISDAEATLNTAVSDAQDARDDAQDARDDAVTAQGLAETAQAAAEAAGISAQADALTAEGWAVGTQDGTAVEAGSTYYHNNAAYYAQVAQQGAEASGYAYFDINDATGEMMVTVASSLADEITFGINENTGVLEVTVTNG